MKYYNGNRLLEQFGGDTALFVSVINEGISHIPGYLERLEEAFAASDCQAIQRHSHKLRGGLLSLLAEIPALTAEKIETAATDNDLETARIHLPVIITEVRGTIDDMIEIKKQNS